VLGRSDVRFRDPYIAAFVSATALLLTLATIYIYGAGLNGPPIRSDGVGYYSFLPALFIDHDLSMRTLADRQFNGAIPPYTGINRYPNTGKYLDKYTIGEAALLTPFFLAADIGTRVLGAAQLRTGYSAPYQVATVAAGIIYACAAFVLLYSALRRYFDSFAAVAAMLLITYATNVFHYASYDSIFSHNFSFFLVSALLVILQDIEHDIETSESPRRMLTLAGLVFSLIVTVRVSNLIFGLLFIPFIVRKRAQLAASLPIAASCFISLVVGGLPMLLLQLLYWHDATDSSVVYSYGGSGFHWLSPNFGNFLFSIRKGLFLWEPIVPLALVGLIALPTELRAFRAAVIAVVATQIYLCSSWGWGFFGGSFESRPFVEVMPLLAFPLAASITAIRRRSPLVRSLGVALATILVGINLTLMYGYWLGDIPFDRTTKADLVRAAQKFENRMLHL
jgi:hypothetical protein